MKTKLIATPILQEFKLDSLISEHYTSLMKTVVETSYNDYIKKRDDILESCLRMYATPPIKGAITKGKLKWRGIIMYIKNNGLDPHETWIEQRGVQISPKITYK